jgi:hypothetical protein
MGERPPGRLVPIGCGYPHVRLVMHVRNRSRHTARPKSSRHVDELLDERLAHRGRRGEQPAVGT